LSHLTTYHKVSYYLDVKVFTRLLPHIRDASRNILSLLLFMIRNKNQFQVNSEIHQINTRQHANLHQPSVNATKYQEGVHCIGVKVFNMLPFYIRAEADNSKKI